VKTLDRLDVRPVSTEQGSEVHFDVRARSFLHNQVRSFVGTLERVGAGAWTAEDVAAALAARDRQRCGPVSPACGLYLAGVGYPADPFETAL
jgi:tRNA pseudouridine38-40 synthase